ncbi:uncharacterized protein [Clytia hemisphaerica]|uniref:NACHT domain-containing protein n=1 Tax=Clytia hemisphaerica TaxID=252671 RepID=A0A7M5VGK4_9CNID
MSIQDVPGHSATTTDQGDASICTRHAIAKAVTQHAFDYEHYDFDQENIIGAIENRDPTIGALWPSEYNNWSFHVKDKQKDKDGKNLHYTITIFVEKVSEINSPAWNEALHLLEERHERGDKRKQRKRKREDETPMEIEILDVDEAPKPNTGHSQPPGGPPKPPEPNIQGQADPNPMYVLVYKPYPKKNPHCIFVKSVIDRHFHCLNSWGGHEPEPRVPINQAENQLWKIMLKYDRTPEGNENVSRDDSSYINENKAKITSTSNTVMFNNGKSDKSTPGSCCLEEVLDYISKKLTHEESKKLLKSLGIDDNGSQEEMSKRLENIAWFDLKKELEMIGKDDIIDHIKKKTLITKGLKTASDRLRKHYVNELKDYLVEQPLSPYTEDTTGAKREDVYIDLVVLPSADVDKEWSNSDRAALIEQQKYKKREKSTKDINQILPSDNEAVFVRGVAGIGKTTLLDMFTYKWAKRELRNTASIEFMFHFRCRELNIISNSFNSLEGLFQLKYPNLEISFKDLKEISERVLIVVDGLDELNISENLSTSKTTNQIVFKLLNPKGAWLPNHKVITCGRPKASEFVKKQLPVNSRRKNIELCGFDDENIRKYIENFFGEQKDRADTVQERIEQSYDLRIMARVPVFLYSICSVYKEQLIRAPINTQTELSFFATLIFIKNHFNKKSKGYETVRDIVQDKNVAKVLLCLMELSTTTYMQNKILFRQSEISLLDSPIPLEETGFLSKHSSNLLEPSFQFRHLILQEFLTGLQICVTKDIKPFSGNVELSSCKPTILGIQRMLKMEENELFLLLYKNLEAIHQSRKPDSKAETAFTFDKFVGEFLKIPPSMIKNNGILIIDTFENDCVEFLTLYKESRENFIPAPFTSAEINVKGNYKDVLNIVNLINDLNIKDIDMLHVDEPKYSEYEKHLISLSALGDDYKTVIEIGYQKSFSCKCKQGKLFMYSNPSSLKGIPDDLLKKSTLFDFKIVFEDKYNDDEAVDILNFSRRLLVYNKRIKVSYIQVNGINAYSIVTWMNELKIKKIGELVVCEPKYSEHEKHLISLSALGEEFKTFITIDENEHDFGFQCQRGELNINVWSFSLAEIPDDLLTKSISFDVNIGFEILKDGDMTDAINFLRRLSSYIKPITISGMCIKGFNVHEMAELMFDSNIRITDYLRVKYPSYDEDEMHFITLSPLGEEFETNIEIVMENGNYFNVTSYFECYPGHLSIVCHSVSCSLVDIPNELLQKSTSFRVSIKVQKTDNDKEAENLRDIIKFLQRLTSNRKPIVLNCWIHVNRWNWISHDEKTIRSILGKYNIDMTNINFKSRK